MGCADSRGYREPTKNDIMEFLIVLKKSDFDNKPKCANFHSKIVKYENDIPGVLNCIIVKEYVRDIEHHMVIECIYMVVRDVHYVHCL